LSVDEIIALGLTALKVDKDDIKFFNMPGETLSIKKYGASYFGAYKDELLPVINENFNPYNKPLTEDDLGVPDIPKSENGGIEAAESGVDDKETFHKAAQQPQVKDETPDDKEPEDIKDVQNAVETDTKDPGTENPPSGQNGDGTPPAPDPGGEAQNGGEETGGESPDPAGSSGDEAGADDEMPEWLRQ